VELQEFQTTTKHKECDRNIRDKMELQENINSVALNALFNYIHIYVQGVLTVNKCQMVSRARLN